MYFELFIIPEKNLFKPTLNLILKPVSIDIYPEKRIAVMKSDVQTKNYEFVQGHYSNLYYFKIIFIVITMISLNAARLCSLIKSGIAHLPELKYIDLSSIITHQVANSKKYL